MKNLFYKHKYCNNVIILQLQIKTPTQLMNSAPQMITQQTCKGNMQSHAETLLSCQKHAGSCQEVEQRVGERQEVGTMGRGGFGGETIGHNR